MKSLFSAMGMTLLLVANTTARGATTTTVECGSAEGERRHCPANTSAGILMARSVGDGTCLLGKTWGYDDHGVWVLDGCSADFIVMDVPAETPATVALAKSAPESAPVIVVDDLDAPPAPKQNESTDDVADETYTPNDTWGYLDPGKGFLLGKSDIGELSLSGYALVRYLNQRDGNDVFTDHLGREREVDGRQDIYSHRALVWLNGWMGDPKLRYTIAFCTVTDTDQDALFGNIGYQFDQSFNLYAGIFGNPGSRSMQGSHPYWLGHDRVMADEFFRPFFTQGIFANGTVAPGLWYSASMGNSSSTLGNTARQLDRDFTYGGSLWWMPTTHEFGPRGAYGDWEYHEKFATRFGMSAVFSPEERYKDIGQDPNKTG